MLWFMFFFTVSISSLSICTCFFFDFLLVYGCFLLSWAVEWSFNKVSKRNKNGLLVRHWWYHFLLRVVYIRMYGMSFSPCMLSYREQALWFTLFMWYWIVSGHWRQALAISLTSMGLVCLVSSHQAYSGMQGGICWFQVYEWSGRIKEERPCWFFENVIGFGVSIFGLSNTFAKDMASASGCCSSIRLYFYNKDTYCFETGMGIFLIQGQFRVSLYLAGYIMGANP